MTQGPSSILKQGKLPRVVWDGLGLFNAHSGVGHYGANLYRSLSLMGLWPEVTAQTDQIPAFLAADHAIILPQSFLGRRIQGLKPLFPVYSYRAASLKHTKMIYHGLSNINLPCFGRIRSNDKIVITVHDIIPILTGNKSALAAQFRWLMPRVLERADRVITGSNWARESILETFGTRFSEKIFALGYGTDQKKKIGNRTTSVDCLTIARGESYKRLEMITKIARESPSRKFAVVTDHAGIISMGQRPPNIKIYSGIASDELSELMTSARVLLHPSLYEGWCLPAAEALNAGLFVIYCAGSGIDEVCAHGPEQVVALQPQRTAEDWSQAINDVLSRPKTAFPQINLPTWDEIAQKTLNLYQSLV